MTARHVIFYALGDSYATVLAFGAQVSKIGISCMPADQYRFINEVAYHATPDDLALFVTYTGTLILGWYVVDDNNGSYIGFAPKNHFQDARKIALDNGMSDALITDAQLRRLREGLTINGDRGSEKVALRTSFRGAYLLVLLDNLCAC